MKTSSLQRIQDNRSQGFWSEQSLHQLLRERAQDCPDRLAVADQPNRSDWAGGQTLRLSFVELDAAVDQLAWQLRQQGVAAEDTVLVQLPNVVELVLCYLALSRIGAIVSPIPVQYGRHEIGKIAESIKPALVITLAQCRDQKLADQAREALADQAIKVVSFGDSEHELRALGSLNAEQAQAVAAYEAEHAADADAIVTICWTSGTTGTPKGVPRSHNMWIATARACIEAGDYQVGDRLLNPFPLVNMAAVGAFLYPCLLQGCTLVLHHPIDPPLFLAQMQDERINFTIAPPALLNQLAQSEGMWQQFDFSALRAVGSGSAPLAPWMIQTFAEKYGKQVINFYGSNEGVALFCGPAQGDDPQRRASQFPALGSGRGQWSGVAAQFVRTKVVDAQSGAQISQPGQVGELLIAGPTVFDGYLNSSAAEVFDEQGYFHTGDLVEICGEDADYYRIVGRSKDIINRGGMKISPAELDVLLEGMPGVREAAVCGVADDRLGEKVCACIVPAEEPPTLADVCAYLSEQGVAKFKLPEQLAVIEALPRNPLGKVQRFLLTASLQQRGEAA